ncbi:MAG: dockerin type I domain-containing protein [Rubripirellula sp.]
MKNPHAMRFSHLRRRPRLETLEQRRLLSADAPSVTGVHLSSSETGFQHQIASGDHQLASISWSQLDQVEITFDEPVDVSADALELSGVRQRDHEFNDFELSPDGLSARWRVASSLVSDRYELRLADSVKDAQGLALDGEWWDSHSQVSGDGTAGSDFVFRFNVLVGDVNQDGTTSLNDYGLVAAELDSQATGTRFDIDTDGTVTESDLQQVQDAFGNLDGLGEHGTTMLLRAAGDVNGDQTEEIVVLEGGENARVALFQQSTGELLSAATLNAEMRYIDMEVVYNSDSTPQALAILGSHLQTGGIRVWLWDFASSAPTSSIAFNKSKLAIDLETFTDAFDGGVRIAVLTQALQSQHSRVYVADVESLAITHSVELGRDFLGNDLEIVSGTESVQPALAVAGTVVASGGTRVKIVDSQSGAPIGSVPFGRVNAVDFEVFENAVGESIFALLREQYAGSRAMVDLRRIDGSRAELIVFQGNAAPLDLEVTHDGQQVQLALLSVDDLHFENTVQVSNEDGSEKSTYQFGSGFQTSGFAISDSGDGQIIHVAQHNTLLDASHVKARQLGDNIRRRTVAVRAPGSRPAWYESNRIHGITRLSMVDPRRELERSYYETQESQQAASIFAELGAKTFTRHVLTMDEDPWWPSELPVDANGDPVLRQARDNRGIALDDRENLVQGFINSAWEQNIPMMGYFFDISDATLGQLNPDWVCTNSNDAIVSHTYKGEYLDITGPYGNVVQQRLLEVADMGLSGIYLDFRHVPPNGCWSAQMEADFEAETGLPAPPVANTDEYVQFVQFSARRMTEVISGWEDALQQQYPYLQLNVSVTSVPGLTRQEMNTDLVAIANPKSEFTVAVRRGLNNNVFRNNPDFFEPPHDVRMAFGWTLLREAAEDGLPHVWNAFAPNRDHFLAFLGAVTTYGNIAALDVVEELLLPGGHVDGVASRADMAEGFALGNAISPHLSRADPIRWAAVLFSENSRNERGLNSRQAWEEVVSPTVGAFQAAQQAHKPVSVLTDGQLARGFANDYQVLFLSNPDELTVPQQVAVQDFVALGGTVIENDPSWNWGDEAGYSNAVISIQQMLAEVQAPAPLTVSGLPLGSHSVGYSRANGNDLPMTTVVAISNQFDFSQSSTIFDPIPAENVNATPANIPAGGKVFISDQLLGDDASLSANDVVAMEVVSGEVLTVVRLVNGFEIQLPEIERSAVIVLEPVDSVVANAPLPQSAYHNPLEPADVNADAAVTVLDAHMVLNRLGTLAQGETNPAHAERIAFFDANGDGQITPADALFVLNKLSEQWASRYLAKKPDVPDVTNDNRPSDEALVVSQMKEAVATAGELPPFLYQRIDAALAELDATVVEPTALTQELESLIQLLV